MSSERADSAVTPPTDPLRSNSLGVDEQHPLLNIPDNVSILTEDLGDDRQETIEVAEHTPNDREPLNQNNDSDSEEEYDDEYGNTIDYDPADDSENDQSEEKVTTRYSENVLSLLKPVSLAMLIVIWAVQTLSPVLQASGIAVSRLVY
jgi:hypothetical protein